MKILVLKVKSIKTQKISSYFILIKFVKFHVQISIEYDNISLESRLLS